MFTTGTKLLIGSSVIAIVAAVLYGVTQQGMLGTIGLVSASVALVFLTAINLYVRDSNVSAADIESHATAPAARRPPATSLWPLTAGLGATMVTVGIVTFQATTVLGLIVLLAAITEWTVLAWSERASADQAYNTEVRERIALPLELPILAAIGVGVIIYSISRVMLGLPSKDGAVLTFVVVAALVAAHRQPDLAPAEALERHHRRCVHGRGGGDRRQWSRVRVERRAHHAPPRDHRSDRRGR